MVLTSFQPRLFIRIEACRWARCNTLDTDRDSKDVGYRDIRRGRGQPDYFWTILIRSTIGMRTEMTIMNTIPPSPMIMIGSMSDMSPAKAAFTSRV
jgi:hypothetical protein